MSLDPALRQRIETLLTSHRVVLFMKGEPAAPRCGFSAKAAGILDSLLDGYGHVDVLSDAEIREGIKLYGSWPTIPQLYIDGELVGGSDIIEQMLNSGELHAALGLGAPDRNPPRMTISPAAADAIRAALADQPEDIALHLSVDARGQAQFQLKPAQGGEIAAQDQGITVLFDLASARRADGVQIDWIDDVRGSGIAVRLPGAAGADGGQSDAGAAAVQPVTPAELAGVLARGGDVTVVDVRPAEARAYAPFPHPHIALDADGQARLAALPRDTALAFLCHHGVSSRRAAEHYLAQGFGRVFNIEGGIDAWASDVDPSIPRY